MSTATSRPAEPETGSKPRLTERDRQVLDSTFAIDSRILAIFRIALASFILIEAVRDWGVPRDPDGLFDFLGQYGELIVIPFAVMMLLGYKTRWAVLACWITYGFTIRATFLDADLSVDVGDYILTLSLFWSIFLPLGRHLSLDSRRVDQPPVRFLSLASAAFLLQIFTIYLSAGLLKEMNEWVFDATALQSILANPRFSGGFSEWILQFPTALSVMSVATIALETVGAVLVIMPGKSLPKRRMIIVPMFIGLHLGIALFMNLGIFPYICMFVWLTFLPSNVWDRVWGWFTDNPKKTVPMVDSNKWRALAAGIAMVIAIVSNVITWMYYPDVTGWADGWQTVATYTLLYQQWAMFSVPSSL